MALTTAQRTELETELTALKAARLSFLTGERANRVNYGERGAGFADVSIEDLNKRIRDIENQLAADDPCNPNRRRPMTVRWGG